MIFLAKVGKGGINVGKCPLAAERSIFYQCMKMFFYFSTESAENMSEFKEFYFCLFS